MDSRLQLGLLVLLLPVIAHAGPVPTENPVVEDEVLALARLIDQRIGAGYTERQVTPAPLADADSPRGYWFHDGLRPNNVVSPSPQAIYNASHGVWLWPPKQATRAG